MALSSLNPQESSRIRFFAKVHLELHKSLAIKHFCVFYNLCCWKLVPSYLVCSFIKLYMWTSVLLYIKEIPDPVISCTCASMHNLKMLIFICILIEKLYTLVKYNLSKKLSAVQYLPCWKLCVVPQAPRLGKDNVWKYKPANNYI